MSCDAGKAGAGGGVGGRGAGGGAGAAAVRGMILAGAAELVLCFPKIDGWFDCCPVLML